MFFKVMSNVKKYYALPAVFMAVGKGFSGGYEDYVKNMNDNNVTLAEHTVCCIMGGVYGGIIWCVFRTNMAY